MHKRMLLSAQCSLQLSFQIQMVKASWMSTTELSKAELFRRSSPSLLLASSYLLSNPNLFSQHSVSPMPRQFSSRKAKGSGKNLIRDGNITTIRHRLEDPSLRIVICNHRSRR